MTSYFSTGYLSNLLTSTTSRYNNLRRSLLSDESDGDTEDDSHISRVLRAYYVEKGRPFPPWLPPDPRSAPSTYLQHGPPGRQPVQPGTGRRAGGLSDLWDTPGQSDEPAQPSSLRRGAGRATASPGIPSRPFGASNEGSYRSQSSQGSYGPGRDGSQPQPPPPPPAGGGSAQDRLKARLYGGRNTPSPGPQGQGNPYAR